MDGSTNTTQSTNNSQNIVVVRSNHTLEDLKNWMDVYNFVDGIDNIVVLPKTTENTKDTSVTSIDSIDNIQNITIVKPGYRLQHLKDWMKNSDNLYLGRPCVFFNERERFPSSDIPKDVYNEKFCNPFKNIDLTINSRLYRSYISTSIENGIITRSDMLWLASKKQFGYLRPKDAVCGYVLKDVLLKYFSSSTIL
jgi:hypothetical protein